MFVLYLSELFLKQTGHTKLPFIQHGSSSNDFQIKFPISQQWCLTWRLPYSGQSDFAQIVHYLLWKECVNSGDQQFHKYQQQTTNTNTIHDIYRWKSRALFETDTKRGSVKPVNGIQNFLIIVSPIVIDIIKQTKPTQFRLNSKRPQNVTKKNVQQHTYEQYNSRVGESS